MHLFEDSSPALAKYFTTEINAAWISMSLAQCFWVDLLSPKFFVSFCFWPEIGTLEETTPSGLYSASDECITQTWGSTCSFVFSSVAVLLLYSCVRAEIGA
jgi:hypothetical protein